MVHIASCTQFPKPVISATKGFLSVLKPDVLQRIHTFEIPKSL